MFAIPMIPFCDFAESDFLPGHRCQGRSGLTTDSRIVEGSTVDCECGAGVGGERAAPSLASVARAPDLQASSFYLGVLAAAAAAVCLR
jgi:hypothetical protein